MSCLRELALPLVYHIVKQHTDFNKTGALFKISFEFSMEIWKPAILSLKKWVVPGRNAVTWHNSLRTMHYACPACAALSKQRIWVSSASRLILNFEFCSKCLLKEKKLRLIKSLFPVVYLSFTFKLCFCSLWPLCFLERIFCYVAVVILRWTQFTYPHIL